jgi:NADP-dependent 3-hydroxy acid dehydrogenase YdfG
MDAQVIAISDAARGIGEGTARVRTEAGARVVGVDRAGKALAALFAEPGAAFRSVLADVKMTAEINAAIAFVEAQRAASR